MSVARFADTVRLPRRPSCLLEWFEWSADRVMGLNHQLSSLSCALGEAHYLNRTLLLPARLCLDAKHAGRWSARRDREPYCDGKGHDGSPVHGYSVPTDAILDVSALRQFVGVQLHELPLGRGALGIPAERTVSVW